MGLLAQIKFALKPFQFSSAGDLGAGHPGRHLASGQGRPEAADDHGPNRHTVGPPADRAHRTVHARRTGQGLDRPGTLRGIPHLPTGLTIPDHFEKCHWSIPISSDRFLDFQGELDNSDQHIYSLDHYLINSFPQIAFDHILPFHWSLLSRFCFYGSPRSIISILL